ncbi:MAG: hypothetical protein QF733_02725 [Phycisphaerales bacterium]|jgi:hypothetical protein|nr:hypothetical protein [Phycisphaerales bacterium]
MMRLAGVLAAAMLSGTVWGQDQAASEPPPAAATPPTVEAIIDRYVEATGGREAWASLRSLRGLGRLEVIGAGLTGNVAVFQTRSGFRRSVDVAAGGSQITLRRGDQAWAVRPDGTVSELAGDELRRLMRDGGFNPLLDPTALYSSMSLAGVEDVEGAQAWKVICIPNDAQGASDVRYFDIESGLQVKVVETGEGKAAAFPTEMYMSDYRQVGPVRIAVDSTVAIGRNRIRIVMDAMQANVEIPACLFDPPTGPVQAAPLPDPKETLEAFMKVDLDRLSQGETQRWLARLTDARKAIDDASPNASEMNTALRQFQIDCATHLREITSGGE